MALPEKFYCTREFTTWESVIILPVEIEGKKKNFLFDTGASLTVLNREEPQGRKIKVTGADNRKGEAYMERGVSLNLGEVEFKDFTALNLPMEDFESHVPDLGGLIGQSVINKANWLIDYPHQKITFSSDSLIDESFEKIEIQEIRSTFYLPLTIAGNEYMAKIDLGSNEALTVPADSELAKIIRDKYDFEETDDWNLSINGLGRALKSTGQVDLTMGGFEFDSVNTVIKESGKLRVGNKFFQNYIIYLDMMNSAFYIKKYHALELE